MLVFDLLTETKPIPDFNLFENPSDEEVNELIKLKVKENRMSLAQWIHLVDFMNTDDEVTKSMLVNKLSTFISSMQYSYNDYIHLIEPKRFLLDDRTGEPLP